MAPGHAETLRSSRFQSAAQTTPIPDRTRFGFEISGTTEDFVQRYIYVFGVWEPHLTYWIQDRLQPGDTFVDVGANIGYFTLLAAGCIRKQGWCVAIEASPSIFELLKENLELNHVGSRVRTVNLAASDRDGTLTVYGGPSGNLGLTTTVPNHDLRIETTISRHASKRYFDRRGNSGCASIKIDVEGLEGPVNGVAANTWSMPRGLGNSVGSKWTGHPRR